MEATNVVNETSFIVIEGNYATGLLDTETYYYISIVLRLFANPSTSAAAFFTAIINISTFAQMHFSKGVTLNLLVLSCSDLILAIVSLLTNFCYLVILHGYYFIGGMSVRSMQYACMFCLNYPMYVSLVVTTVIAVVRCLSIVMPLSFRDIVTSRRQLVVIAFFSCFAMAFPLYTQINTMLISVSSKRMAGLASNNQMAIMDIFRNIFLYSCLCVIIFSMFFLIFAHKKSSKFQSTASSFESTANEDKRSSKMASREAQIVKTVIIILAIFVACNVPLNLLAVLRQTIPEFSSTARHDKGNATRISRSVLEMFLIYFIQVDLLLSWIR